MVPLLLTALACGKGELNLEPSLIEWGEIDFQDDACADCQCEEGCGPTLVELFNIGDGPLNIEVPDGLDPDRFCLQGYDDVSEPLIIPELEPDATYLLELSVCGYLAGEQTLTVSGQIVFETDGAQQQVGLSWSYTPVRIQ